MKRLIVFILCAIFIVLFGLLFKSDIFTFAKSNSNYPIQYKVYVSSLSELAQLPNDVKITDLGFCYEVCSKTSINTNQTTKTMGYSTVFKCSKNDINRLFSQNSISIIDSYYIDDCLVFEGYVRLNNGSLRNIQAAYNLGKLTIGSPVIFGAY